MSRHSSISYVSPANWIGFAGDPAPPVFIGAGGGGGGASDVELRSSQGFWLWPLPPPEPFTFAVEWLAAGVELTMTEIDGAAIVTASQAAEPFWPAAL